jgi:hypothetical protein
MYLRGSRKAGDTESQSVRIPWRALAVAWLLLISFVAAAHAQPDTNMFGEPKSGRVRRGPQQETTPHPQALLPLPSIKQPWPRLDAGAVLCKSRDDLLRYQTRSPGPAPDCHVIRQRTAIQVLDRDGPSHTHVVATDDPKQTGWTDTYLPAEPPPSATTNTAAKQK